VDGRLRVTALAETRRRTRGTHRETLLVREESHLEDMRRAIRGDFARLKERRGEDDLLGGDIDASEVEPPPAAPLDEAPSAHGVIPDAEPEEPVASDPMPDSQPEPPSVPEPVPPPPPAPEPPQVPEPVPPLPPAPEPPQVPEPVPPPVPAPDLVPPLEPEPEPEQAVEEPGRRSWLDRLLGR
jgi:hypothetical protein